MRAHVVTNGVITNTIEIASLDAMPGLIAADTGTIGDSVVDGVIVPAPAPPVPVPQSVTMRQARLALHAANLLSGVNAAIAAMDEPAKTAANIEWEYSNTVERNKPFVQQLGAALNLDSAALDALFIEAAKL